MVNIIHEKPGYRNMDIPPSLHLGLSHPSLSQFSESIVLEHYLQEINETNQDSHLTMSSPVML